jgi:tetratricopeptide (TPR) repeat protein
MTLRRHASVALSTLALLLLLAGACAASAAKRAAEEGGRLYDEGKYEEALPLLEKAADQGIEDGELFYQLAYVYEFKSMADKSRSYREKAIPLLEKKARSKRGSLESWYYLTAVYANLDRTDEVAKAAREGIARYGEKTGLSAEDQFRLGRLYQFAGDGSRGAAVYRRAVEAFEASAHPNAVLFALALLADARTDFSSRRYAEASKKFDRAAPLAPWLAPSPYERALLHLGAGELDKAAAEFAQVRDENLLTEAQYGADVARRLGGAGGATDKTSEGKSFMELDNAALGEAIQKAADGLKAARDAESAGKGGGETRRASERLFFSLVAEWMLRGNPIREQALSGGYADLIRR